MTTFGAIIVPFPIITVFDLADIDVPFNPTLSSMIILADLDHVLNFVGAYRELAVHLLDEDTIETLLPILIILPGARIIWIGP